MRYRIRFTDDADEDWAALSTPARRRIRVQLRELTRDPFPRSSLALCGTPDHLRVRAGGYRIIYGVDVVPNEPNLITVFRVRPRATAYVGYEFTKT